MATKKQRASTTYQRIGPTDRSLTEESKHALNRLRNEGDTRVVRLDERVLGSERAGPVSDADYIITFPKTSRIARAFTIDLTFLLPLRNFAEAIRDGHLAKLGPRPNKNTAVAYTKDLKNGVVAFLLQNGYTLIGITDIDTKLLTEYEVWLNQSKGDTARWNEATRTTRYLYFRTILNCLRDTKKWRRYVPNNIRFVSNPWPDGRSATKHKSSIDDDLMTRIRLASIKDITTSVERRNTLLAFVETMKAELNPKKHVEPGLSKLRSKDDENLLDICCLLQQDPAKRMEDLPSYLRTFIGNCSWSFTQIRDAFYPSARGLIPFVILDAIASAYNANTVREVRLDDFHYIRDLSPTLAWEERDAGDEPERKHDAENMVASALMMNALKPRAGKRQPVYFPIDEDYDNPHFILQFVTEWTNKLRLLARGPTAQKLFIFYAKVKVVSSFSGADGLTDPSTANYALRRFREDHQLEYFTLDNIRPTILDLAFRLFGGDIRLVGAQANHGNVDTTSGSYQTEGEKRRQFERLGKLAAVRNRWRETAGTIDPRDHTEEFDRDCATPGWTCLDPYDSPYSLKGKLCSSYGMCPACPLGNVNLNSPLSCAYTLALLDAVNTAQQSVHPSSWIKRWGPIQQKLIHKWVPSFSSQAIKQARRINLPPMPSPE
ncbi:hypothetical protein [Caballeronia concitans]|uniref:Uncharacterized protein n=1 Tax=Caballeronia concitans TaxID=1777133 RepID=A0A658R5A8_9BURK|nr:hypothetical protein [Caballeronia concitans]SAL52344.1 hypothetical protein AWB72_05571 [Caballeronia concitans]